MTERRYLVNEMFHSLQGEGVRAGTPAVFLRFAKCNLACNVAEHGFDCDTDFDAGFWMTSDELRAAVDELSPLATSWVILTGGEPSLQIDDELIEALHLDGHLIAIETNGTRELPFGIDWITVSPKTGEDQLRQRKANEVKYVRAAGQPIPNPTVRAQHYLISPAFTGDELDPATLAWCIELVKNHPGWRLSVQQHKQWGVR